MNEFVFSLGDKVKSRLTGLTGIVTTRSECLFGCNRYWVTPQELKDGKPVEGMWVDEDEIDCLQSGVIAPRRYRVYESDPIVVKPIRRAGGPTSQPASQTGPTTR